MTMFSKLKDGPARSPERCERCGECVGTAALTFTVGAEAGQLAPAERQRARQMWLCAACQAQSRREGEVN